ncbi:MAG: hypothetical protein ACRDT4_17410 [Micromonosporaceae bacterium]
MTIGGVKSGVANAANRAKQGLAELRAVRQSIDEAIARVRSATQGTSRDEVDKAVTAWQSAQAELDQATAAIMTGVEQSETYAARI